MQVLKHALSRRVFLSPDRFLENGQDKPYDQNGFDMQDKKDGEVMEFSDILSDILEHNAVLEARDHLNRRDNVSLRSAQSPKLSIPAICHRCLLLLPSIYVLYTAPAKCESEHRKGAQGFKFYC